MGRDNFIVDVDELIKKRERKPIKRPLLERVGRGIQKVGGEIKESLKDTPEKRVEELKLLKAQRKVLEQKRMIAVEKAKIQKLQPSPSRSEFGFGPFAEGVFPEKKKKKGKGKQDDIFFQDDMFRF